MVSSVRLDNFPLLFLSCYVYFCCSGGWTISGAPLDLHDPRMLAMAAAQRHFLEADYDEYSDTNANGAAFCRSAALVVSSYSVFLDCNSS